MAIIFNPFKLLMWNSFWSKVTADFDNQKNVVYLKDLTDYKWNKVCILQPYSVGQHNRDAKLAKLIPADLGEFKAKVPNLDDDALWAFVFINGDTVVGVEKKGYEYYLRLEGQKVCLNDNAQLIVDPNHKNYLIISEKK